MEKTEKTMIRTVLAANTVAAFAAISIYDFVISGDWKTAIIGACFSVANFMIFFVQGD